MIGAVSVGIFYVPKEERACGHGIAGGAAVGGAEDVEDAGGGVFVAADVDEGANDGAYHVAQEAVGCNFEVPTVGAGAVP